MPNKNEKRGNYIWFYLRKHLPPTHQQKGSTYLITHEESFRSSYSIFSVKGLLRSSSYYSLEKEDHNKVFPHNLMVWTLPSLSVCQKYSVSKVLFSLLICMYWPSVTSKPCQSEIFCLIACSYMRRERIFYFGSVCWSWKANRYMSAERTRLWRHNISGKQREKVEFIWAKSLSYEQFSVIVEDLCFTLLLVRYDNLLENCWKCNILEYWGTFHNSFHNLNLTLSCLHNAKQE